MIKLVAAGWLLDCVIVTTYINFKCKTTPNVILDALEYLHPYLFHSIQFILALLRELFLLKDAQYQSQNKHIYEN